MTIINDWSTVNYYHKELYLRYCNGPRSPFAYTRIMFSDGMEFSRSKFKHSLPQNWIDDIFISHFFFLNHVYLVARNLLFQQSSLLLRTCPFIPAIFITTAMLN